MVDLYGYTDDGPVRFLTAKVFEERGGRTTNRSGNVEMALDLLGRRLLERFGLFDNLVNA
jgi:hypothetical protein